MLVSPYASRLRPPVLRRPRRDTYLRGGGRGAWISPPRLLRTRRPGAATTYPPGFSFTDPWHETVSLTGFLCGVSFGDRVEPGDAARDAAPPGIDRQAARRARPAESGPLAGRRLGWLEPRGAVGTGRRSVTPGRPPRRDASAHAATWEEEEVSVSGPEYVLDRVAIHPRPKRRIPLWLGGGGLGNQGEPPERGLRRAARHGDGFKLMAPTGIDPARGSSSPSDSIATPKRRAERSVSRRASSPT